MSDEKYYLQVEQELKESLRDKALWSKCMALARDDETEAKAKYIQKRVSQLKKKELQKKAKQFATKILKRIENGVRSWD